MNERRNRRLRSVDLFLVCLFVLVVYILYPYCNFFNIKIFSGECPDKINIIIMCLENWLGVHSCRGNYFTAFVPSLDFCGVEGNLILIGDWLMLPRSYSSRSGGSVDGFFNRSGLVPRIGRVLKKIPRRECSPDSYYGHNIFMSIKILNIGIIKIWIQPKLYYEHQIFSNQLKF